MTSISTGVLFHQPCRRLSRVLLPSLIFLSLMLTSCTAPDSAGGQATRLLVPLASVAAAQQQIQRQRMYPLETRPAGNPQAIAEFYLQQYQPGPLPRVFETSYVYDRTGRLLAERSDEGQRIWIPLKSMSQHLLDAVIATEDGGFYTNNGVDERRIVGALVQKLRTGARSGASTITMQLVRMLFLSPEDRYAVSFDRKITEVCLAQELTQLFTKEELLEIYLNLGYFGHLAYGPEAAARAYFGKSALDLDAAEAALLAGLLQRPAQLDPFQNFDGAKERQRIVLDLMVRRGYITAVEADAYFDQPLTLGSDPLQQPELAPHFVQFVADYVSRLPGNPSLGRSGLVITTTLDLDLQELAQQTVREHVDLLRPRFNLNNAALVALKTGTAEIMAMVGSADFTNNEIDGQVNVTIRGRQPGSAIKPVVYAVAMNTNMVSPATLLWDVPITYTLNAKEDYEPLNYDRTYRGPVTVRTALANSLNVPTIKLFDGLVREDFLAFANAMGITSLTEDDLDRVGLALALGGDEITPFELTTAYHTIANGGRFVEPTPVLAITDIQGRAVALPPSTPPRQTISPATAFLVTDIISDNEARALIFGENSRLKLTKPAAAKTGTTTDYRDNWTVGFTRYLVTGVWAGNNDGRPMRNADGITGAGPIWQRFMEAIIADPALQAKIGVPAADADWAFPPPADVVQVAQQCPPEIDCRTDGEYFSTVWVNQRENVGPYADSFLTGAFARVTVRRANGSTVDAGLCRLTPASAPQDRAAVLTMLVEPHGLGRLSPQLEAASFITTSNSIIASVPASLRAEQFSQQQGTTPVAFLGSRPRGAEESGGFVMVERDRVLREQQAVRRWMSRKGQLLTLGDCNEIAPFLYAAYGSGPQDFTIGPPLTANVAAGMRPVVEAETGSEVADTVNFAPGAPNGIFSPAPGAPVAGVVSIRAAAADPNFRKWQLDILVNGQEASFLGLGDQPTAAPTDIFLWDTTNMPDGDHVLRLRVVRRDGNYDEFFVPVNVRNS